ncbi:SUN-family protein [Neisseria gonorrhoeae]|uniref:SUN-family protein n=1 Tax=Neisseria gonorrhoeae TaxID=485 RepID=A0A378VZY9_NEIGO|nr:SUN-family protein [Neisseria gonorrhoeae]
MNAAQLDHTAKVLAEMLTFKQPADAVLSAYFRKHKSSAAKTATKSPKPPLPRCDTIKNQYRPAPSARAAAQSRTRRAGSRQKYQHQPNQRPA